MGSLQLLVSWMQKRAEKQNNVLVYEEGEVIKLMQSLQTGLIPDSTSPAAAFATFRRLCASFPLSSSHPNPYSLSLLSGQEMVSRMCGELRECLSVPLGEEGAVKALFEMCLKPMAIIPEPTEIRESPTPPKHLHPRAFGNQNQTDSRTEQNSSSCCHGDQRGDLFIPFSKRPSRPALRRVP